MEYGRESLMLHGQQTDVAVEWGEAVKKESQIECPNSGSREQSKERSDCRRAVGNRRLIMGSLSYLERIG